jgi:hypothetical protein
MLAVRCTRCDRDVTEADAVWDRIAVTRECPYCRHPYDPNDPSLPPSQHLHVQLYRQSGSSFGGTKAAAWSIERWSLRRLLAAVGILVALVGAVGLAMVNGNNAALGTNSFVNLSSLRWYLDQTSVADYSEVLGELDEVQEQMLSHDQLQGLLDSLRRRLGRGNDVYSTDPWGKPVTVGVRCRGGAEGRCRVCITTNIGRTFFLGYIPTTECICVGRTCPSTGQRP